MFIFACIYRKHLAKSYMISVIVALYHQANEEGEISTSSLKAYFLEVYYQVRMVISILK